ncbi:NAD(P)-dependent oxidoreductase [Endozoicomonas sp. OPT23]|uniref:SDR family oxidoreductase n=1 Tax=Endozoicomonas sp. OPT23 TaxID=2072845 RepID=UPI00129B71DC|nr:SDR family oxidoreductase [Endozoicomonas sp. OPT23]MRI31426.1 NAD(P)-dependent oxidoreductase [Endozoicomonas sp. OPT23]
MKKVALITGSSRGIGAASARLLAEKGYDICINYLKNAEQAERLAEELQSHEVNVIAVQADVSQEEDVVRLFTTIDDLLGAVTALVNNAAILLPQTTVEEMSAERINRMMTTNITSYFLCCREAVKRMAIKNGGNGGAIVNVSSAASRIGAANEYVDYAASKGAIDTLTRGLSNEVAGEGIRVNCVRPGLIYTDMHADGGEPGRVDRLKSSLPLQRGGTAEEVANSIAWLLSDEASYITGSFTDIAGGR